MRIHSLPALTLACMLAAGSTVAWGADRELPPLANGQANAFALQLAGTTGLAGAGLFAITEMLRIKGTKEDFAMSQPILGWAAGGSTGGAAAGLGLALFVDRQPSWIGAVGATLAGVALEFGGLLLLNSIAAQSQVNDAQYALVGITLPVFTSLASAASYLGLRTLTTPNPAPTPTPLETPWPTPSPPVGLFL